MPVSSTLDSRRAFLLFYLSIVDNAHFVMFTGLALISDIHRCVSKSSSEARFVGSFSQLHTEQRQRQEKNRQMSMGRSHAGHPYAEGGDRGAAPRRRAQRQIMSDSCLTRW